MASEIFCLSTNMAAMTALANQEWSGIAVLKTQWQWRVCCQLSDEKAPLFSQIPVEKVAEINSNKRESEATTFKSSARTILSGTVIGCLFDNFAKMACHDPIAT